MRQRMPELFVGLTAAVLDAEQLRQLLDDDVECDSEHEAFEHRLRDEIGNKAKLPEPGDQEEKAEHDGDGRSQNHILLRVAYHQRCECGGENRRRSRGWRDGELPAGAEDRIGQQAERRCVQSGLGR